METEYEAIKEISDYLNQLEAGKLRLESLRFEEQLQESGVPVALRTELARYMQLNEHVINGIREKLRTLIKDESMIEKILGRR